MSRGGGARGGRGGRRGGRGDGAEVRNYSWDNDPNVAGLQIENKPSDLYPPYDAPFPHKLSKREEKAVQFFRLFREQVHDGPLYSQTRTWNLDTDEPRRMYGQEQINNRFGVHSKATTDPFLSVLTYSMRFEKKERTLPDLTSRPFAKEFFPKELYDALDGRDGLVSGTGKCHKSTERKIHLSGVETLRTAEEIFGIGQPQYAEGPVDQAAAMEMLNRIDENGENIDYIGSDDEDDLAGDEGMDDGEENPDEYDDESDNDYNAEVYFDNGEDDYDDEGGGDEDGIF